MKLILVFIALAIVPVTITAKKKLQDTCYDELNKCRYACNTKEDLTGECILRCYEVADKCDAENNKRKMR